ncbi:hypothetical protein FACS189411_00160 [Bacteroidia bacterium]|nr:hypothetical protein FACS189411_00160 [Bacteroidia bacterium]
MELPDYCIFADSAEDNLAGSEDIPAGSAEDNPADTPVDFVGEVSAGSVEDSLVGSVEGISADFAGGTSADSAEDNLVDFVEGISVDSVEEPMRPDVCHPRMLCLLLHYYKTRRHVHLAVEVYTVHHSAV